MKKAFLLFITLFSLWLPPSAQPEESAVPEGIITQTKIEKIAFTKPLNMSEVYPAGRAQPLHMTRDYRQGGFAERNPREESVLIKWSFQNTKPQTYIDIMALIAALTVVCRALWLLLRQNKPLILTALLALALITGISLPSFAGEEADLGNIGKVFRDLRIEKIEYNRELGMYEIRLADTPQPLYMTKDYRYVFIGSVIDVANKRNLTEEKSPKAGNFQKIDFAALPLEKAIKISEGSRKLAVFLDPDCPYSRRIYPELKKLRDVSLHVFFYPLEFHPRAKEKSISAWCAEDRAAAVEMLFNGKREIEKRECPNPVEGNIALAMQNGLKGVPAMVFENGRVASGYMKAEQLTAYLEGAPAVRESAKEKGGEHWGSEPGCQPY